jgi:hypothetical protein
MPLGPIVTSAWASVIELFGTAMAPAKAGNTAKQNAAENTKVAVFMTISFELNLVVQHQRRAFVPCWLTLPRWHWLPQTSPMARCSEPIAAYLNLTTELSEWSHCGHSKVRKSWPSLWGSIRVSVIVEVHLGHVGRRIASDEWIDEGE